MSSVPSIQSTPDVSRNSDLNSPKKPPVGPLWGVVSDSSNYRSFSGIPFVLTFVLVLVSLLRNCFVLSTVVISDKVSGSRVPSRLDIWPVTGPLDVSVVFRPLNGKSSSSLTMTLLTSKWDRSGPCYHLPHPVGTVYPVLPMFMDPLRGTGGFSVPLDKPRLEKNVYTMTRLHSEVGSMIPHTGKRTPLWVMSFTSLRFTVPFSLATPHDGTALSSSLDQWDTFLQSKITWKESKLIIHNIAHVCIEICGETYHRKLET